MLLEFFKGSFPCSLALIILLAEPSLRQGEEVGKVGGVGVWQTEGSGGMDEFWKMIYQVEFSIWPGLYSS